MKFFINVVFLWFALVVNAQVASTDILLTVDGDPIKAEEFIRVYNKNLDLVKDDSQKDVDAYLKLFIDYQLKIKEAKRLGLHKSETYLKEFGGYRDQLIKNYLTDSKVTESLIKEAYDRMGFDVKASHVLILLDESETDTLRVYQDVLALRNRVMKEGFTKVKAEVHDGKRIFAEELGYFTTFNMVYEFENAAYNTPVGDISMPFRTQFGYHIVKVEDKRSALGEVTVAHIMLTTTDQVSEEDASSRITEIYKKIQQGESFDSLAKQFSEDKSSAQQGGVLAPFTGGQLSAPEFENAAFSLATVGAVSKPFKTNYGWHIVKLLDKKGIPSYDEEKLVLENKIKRDSRSKLINMSLANDLRETYKISYNPTAKAYFKSIMNADFFTHEWKLPSDFAKTRDLFYIEKDTITFEDFGTYLNRVQQAYIGKTISFEALYDKEYKNFEDQTLIQYQKDHLEYENDEFAHIIKEYRDGLLLFDLMEKEIWNAAALDTLGLKNYYNTHQDAYVWETRADLIMATAGKEVTIKTVEKLWKKGHSFEDIDKELNTTTEQKVIFTEAIKPLNDYSFPEDLELKKGLSEIFFHNDGYHVVKVKNVLPKANKTFYEAKGNIISDYQMHLEQEWLKKLNEQYEVQVNSSVLRAIKSQINISK